MNSVCDDVYIEELIKLASNENIKFYLVGGAVRDFLLSKDFFDIDVVAFGDIENFAKKVANHFGCSFLRYEKKLLTYRIFCPLKTIDIAASRGRTIEEDLKRRDFTINSIAYDFETKNFIDPSGGIEDINRGIIRATYKESTRDDPVRILRGFRLAAEYRFDIEPETIDQFRRDVELLKFVSKERIVQELKRFFALNNTFAYLLLMDKVGVLDTLFEDLSKTNGCIQSNFHLYDVKTHSLNVYNYIEWAVMRLKRIMGRVYKDYIVHYTQNRNNLLAAFKLAALFHDAAKPFCKVITNDRKVRFPNHETESAKLFLKYAKVYPFGKKITTLAQMFIENHIKPSNIYVKWSVGELERFEKVSFFLEFGESGIDLLIFALADTLAKGKISSSKRDVYVMFLKEMAYFYYRDFLKIAKNPPLINGNDVLKIFPAIEKKKINPVLYEIRRYQLSGIIKDRQEALNLLKKIV